MHFKRMSVLDEDEESCCDMSFKAIKAIVLVLCKVDVKNLADAWVFHSELSEESCRLRIDSS